MMAAVHVPAENMGPLPAAAEALLAAVQKSGEDLLAGMPDAHYDPYAVLATTIGLVANVIRRQDVDDPAHVLEGLAAGFASVLADLEITDLDGLMGEFDRTVRRYLTANVAARTADRRSGNG